MYTSNDMILGKDAYYSLDCYETKRNNNVCVVGASGAGKTRSIVIPNLLQATGSYVVSDPKGNLYRKYRKYLKDKGYVVKCVDFTHPTKSAHYNFFNYIHNETDIIRISHMLAGNIEFEKDPFWDHTSELLTSAIIALLLEAKYEDSRNLESIIKLLNVGSVSEYSEAKTTLDRIFDERRAKNSKSFAVRQYDKVRVAAPKTFNSVLITIQSKLGIFENPELNQMMASDSVNFASLGKRKTALFVVVSDTDRSMDRLANIFFTQAMSELCKYADEKCKDQKLPVDVRFILDDFATNVVIDEFPRMISSIRSRGISTMLMLQSEGQLQKNYGPDAQTIICNCDTYVYLGGNDIETAKHVSERSNVLLEKILNMPVGSNWIFRRGEKPQNGTIFDLDSYIAV